MIFSLSLVEQFLEQPREGAGPVRPGSPMALARRSVFGEFLATHHPRRTKGTHDDACEVDQDACQVPPGGSELPLGSRPMVSAKVAAKGGCPLQDRPRGASFVAQLQESSSTTLFRDEACARL